METLKLIACDNYSETINTTIKDFENCFITHDFPKAWWIVTSNSFFETVYDEEMYGLLVTYFNQYRNDMMYFGRSNVFNGVNSINDLKKISVIHTIQGF